MSRETPASCITRHMPPIITCCIFFDIGFQPHQMWIKVDYQSASVDVSMAWQSVACLQDGCHQVSAACHHRQSHCQQHLLQLLQQCSLHQHNLLAQGQLAQLHRFMRQETARLFLACSHMHLTHTQVLEILPLLQGMRRLVHFSKYSIWLGVLSANPVTLPETSLLC